MPTRSLRADYPLLGEAVAQTDAKRAERLARQIERDIALKGWPVGERLGQEPDLLARYGTSRAVFREAARILEQQGIAEMRRGPKGGLCITAPARHAAARTLASYLEFTQVTIFEIIEARSVLQTLAARLAASRLSRRSADMLKAAIEALHPADRSRQSFVNAHLRVREAIAEATGNPVLILFMEVLNEVTTDYIYFSAPRPSGSDGEGASLKQAIVAAILDRDGERAAAAVRDDLDYHRALIRQVEADSAATRQDPNRQSRFRRIVEWTQASGLKLSEVIARALLAEIREMSWPVGRNLGSESHFLETFDVSRAAFREAVRLLERYEVARMKRGPGGGLIVTEPTPDHAVTSAATFLIYSNILAHHYYEVRLAVEAHAAARAAERMDVTGRSALRGAIARFDRAATPDELVQTSSALHILIGKLSGNRALAALLHTLLIVTTGGAIWSDLEPAALHASLRQSHARIVEALLAGDVDAARARTVDHVKAVLPRDVVLPPDVILLADFDLSPRAAAQ